ncbi:CapA family protein [Nesterenkonia pannonica]|uniref:CapA family protein n=1 Tax=Nesterenkonia pannonica TaxID=1548602 RepID=UPI002164053F|nr:CapA family protein [Nesterenkonia pannonica]
MILGASGVFEDAAGTVRLPKRVGGGEIRVDGASGDSPSIPHTRPDVFQVAFPHWPAKYSWRTRAQKREGKIKQSQGADLVVGWGSHCLQEVEHRNSGWLVYGLGRGAAAPDRRFARPQVERHLVACSFVAVLELSRRPGRRERSVSLKLYPVYAGVDESG